MPKLNHLRLLGHKQLAETTKVKFNFGFGEKEEDEEPVVPNYVPMAQRLETCRTQFIVDRSERQANRDTSIQVPANIEFIRISFLDQFILDKFFTQWVNEFGLEAVTVSNFGKEVLFAVIDKVKFKHFTESVLQFARRWLLHDERASFSNKITYIDSFRLLTSADILRFDIQQIGEVVVLNTLDFQLLSLKLQQALLNSMEVFLTENNVNFTIDGENNRIELFGATAAVVKQLADNFDIVESITCSLSSVVRPSDFNVTKREYGFRILNANEDLPLIGILDTGISMQTPLADITLQDTSFTLAGNPLTDTAGGRHLHGHGTGVAALAALGRENHLNEFNGEVRADAKLLSLKLSDTGSGYLSETKIIEMLYAAKAKYPELSIFVLTTCYNDPKAVNETFSSYTYLLDKFAYETDSLIFICTANNNDAVNENSTYDLHYFENPDTNLSTPSDSLNNVTIGGAAENLRTGAFLGCSPGREYPTLFTRKGHVDLSLVLSGKKSNNQYFKPDVIDCSGDIVDYGLYLDYRDDVEMQILSANPAFGFFNKCGTSFSAPLSANIAAKIKKKYPDLRMQTIKALIVNGASMNNIKTSIRLKKLIHRIAGNGYVDAERSLFSSEGSPTLILEDKIENDKMKIYPVHFPQYLIEEALGKNNGILKCSATLCFSFKPIQHNQLSYNPIHMAFGFFRDHTGDQINAKKKDCDSHIKSTLNWSQSGRHKSKPIPYSNCQKMDFLIDVKNLTEENCTLKLAVQSRLTAQLLQSDLTHYPTEYPFSLVINIEENFKLQTGRLYEELVLINELEVIADASAEAVLEA
ncbi:MAG TPA: S8 family serine peptidase [Paludibacter sp.]|nr:S8 family serine peptidase [Paludibacter sp.]